MVRRLSAVVLSAVLVLAPACGDDDTTEDPARVPEADTEGPVGEGGPGGTDEDEGPEVNRDDGGVQEEDENAPTGDPGY